MTADFVEWEDEYVLDHRRRQKTAAFVSLAVHACVLGLFAVTPPRPVAPIPEAISVDLIAAPAPSPPAPGAARAAPRPAEPPPPAPKPVVPPPPAIPPPAPSPAVAPAPPNADAPVQVLPEETPGRIREAKPKPPKVVAAAKPEPKPTPAPPPPPPKVEEPAYEDDEAAMAALMEELGADESLQAVRDSAQAQADRAAALAEAAESAGTATGKIQLSPEQVAWDRAVIQKISKKFPVPARSRGRRLVAQVEIQVAASGMIVGEPKLVGTSGDRNFDGWALSAIQLASPLPPPPVAGVRRLNMRSEEY